MLAPIRSAPVIVLLSVIGCSSGDNGSRPSATATATAISVPATATSLPTAASKPTGTPAALCAERRGGALITFEACEATFTLWSTAGAFIDEAAALLQAGEQRIPIFSELLDGTDCDGQWTWHADAAAMSFADFTIELCDGCPFHIEDDKPYWLETVGQYCPWSARVVAVEDRR